MKENNASHQLNITEFKAKCLSLLDKTSKKGTEYTITKRGEPIARVIPVKSGTKTLKDAMSEAMRAWAAEVQTMFYVIGTVAGPHPYPMMVRDFQSVIGEETRKQIMEKEGRLPDTIVACVGGGSNAAGIFYPFIGEPVVNLVGVEAAGLGIGTGKHAASIGAGQAGILHGCKTYVLQNEDGQVLNAHSISAGLDYPGVGPQHAYWADNGNVEYCSITDAEAIDAFYEKVKPLDGKRWYDQDPVLAKAVELLRVVPQNIQRQAAQNPDRPDPNLRPGKVPGGRGLPLCLFQ